MALVEKSQKVVKVTGVVKTNISHKVMQQTISDAVNRRFKQRGFQRASGVFPSENETQEPLANTVADWRQHIGRCRSSLVRVVIVANVHR